MLSRAQFRWVGRAVGGAPLATALATAPARAATIVVDRTDDLPDTNPGNGMCSVGGPVPRCTLRAALEEANATAGSDTINFAIGAVGSPQTITRAAALRATGITQPVVINGYTQGGAGYTGPPLIELSAASCGATGALDLRAGSTGRTIRGLLINRCPTRAISIVGSNKHVIVGNYLGTNRAGTAWLANNTGIYLQTSTGNVIGGVAATDRNLISGNTVDGVQVDGAAASNNTIQGNFIGTNAAGTAALPNARHGVFLGSGANGNTVGGIAPGSGNVISGNGQSGVVIDGAGTTGNVV